MVASQRQNLPTAQNHVRIQISPVIAADFTERQVFPELLRPADAVLRISYSHIYRVSIDFAEKVLADAKDRYDNRRAMPRGRATAFSSLIDRLEDDLMHAKGIWRDPGRSMAVARQNAELARFEVGARVRWCSPWEDERDGKALTIVESYGIHSVLRDTGEYLLANVDDVRRGSYMPGYLAKDDNGKQCFYSPHEIQTWDYKPGYLQLVCSEGRNV